MGILLFQDCMKSTLDAEASDVKLDKLNFVKKTNQWDRDKLLDLAVCICTTPAIVCGLFQHAILGE